MDWQKLYETIERKSDKIAYLKGLLESSDSPVGDWKMVKIYESRLIGAKGDPYDPETLIAERQKIRDEINRLQELPDDEGETA